MLWLILTGGFVLLAVGIFGLGAFNLATGKTTLLPASLFQAINPLLIVALAPTFSNMWSKLDSGKFKSSTPTKMAIGMVLLGVGFMVLYVGQKLALSSGTQASAAWLAGVYFIHTLGELCLSPIGLSMVTKLAPPRVTSLAMGLWLFSSAVANYLAGILESLLTKVHVPIYGFLIVSSIGPAVLLLALTPLLKKWMHGKA
jgi:POT family proton-dependent oligopeptide transporter